MGGQKTILVPIDFRVASLNTLRLALELIDEPTVHVVLLHCETLDDSITERLFYSPRQIISDSTTNDFDDAVSILRNRFEHIIGNLRIELFHGYLQNTFDAMLERLNVDLIFVPDSYRLQLTKRAFDPLPYIKKCKVPHYELGLGQQYTMPEADRLENLFL